MSNGVKSWSFSAWKLYDQCPFKFKCLKIDKLKEPQSPHLKRGNDIHKEMELYLVGKLDEVPESGKEFASLLEMLRGLDPFVEQEWAFTDSWGRTKWRDWKNCWLRVKTDVCVIAGRDGLIVDHKTGKKYDENVEQIELFALSGFHIHPQVDNFEMRLWYLDSGEEVVEERSRDQVPEMKAAWMDRIGPMFNDTIFAPKPNKFCDWCHFRKSNGGPCSHG